VVKKAALASSIFLSRMKVPRSDEQDEIPVIEARLLSKVLTDSLEKMTPEELDEFA
jgi:uncharacterized protein YaaW (UPF0174 family)